jgi:peptide/nickel transport system ATP-binding protein
MDLVRKSEETGCRERVELARKPAERILELQGVTKRLRSGRHTVEVLKGVDLAVHRGEVVALIGPSGAGKTTLLHILAGLLRADSGKASFAGAPLPLEEIHNGRERMSLVFQDPYAALSSHMRLRETVLEPLRIRGKRKSEDEKACEALRSVNLVPPEAYLDRHPAGLSGGQRQRAAIARAVITHPCLLLADEPTSMLDASAGVGILNLFRSLAAGGTAILITIHDLATACYVADRLLIIYDGVIIEEGTPQTILSAPRHETTRALVAAAGVRRSRSGERFEAEAGAEVL